ncbi:MAG: hypothetical protein JSV17_17370 [Candidatus Aminicenantes bacterium]|nr:MAG: hypothetical protein JSV17_17370 [Candidatus Aminicenantes bacterium]
MIFLILLLVVPLLIGYFLVFLKIGAIHAFTVDLYYWLKEKRQNILSGRGKLANIGKFTLEPLYSLLIAINDWTENIENAGTKSGVRIAGYLYLIGILLFIFFTLGQFLFLLALIGVGILLGTVVLNYLRTTQKKAKSKQTQANIQVKQAEGESLTFMESIWPHFRSKKIRDRVEDLFGLKQIEVDYHGDIFSSDITLFPVKTKIGCVDKNGGIYDTRKELPEKIGSIDVQGNIVDERFFNLDDLTH